MTCPAVAPCHGIRSGTDRHHQWPGEKHLPPYTQHQFDNQITASVHPIFITKQEFLKSPARFTEDAGVPFPEGTALVYNKQASMIIIRNTPENIDEFERVLDNINAAP
jgi:hypothetical protein